MSHPRMPRNVWVLSLVAFLVAVGFGVVVPVLPVFARSFGASQFATGAVVSAFALARLVTSPWCSRINNVIGERVALGVGIGIVAASSAGAGLAQDYLHLLVLRGLGGIGSAMFSVSAMTLLLASAEMHHRGRASAMFQGGFLLGGMAGPAVGGILAAISLRAPFFFYAGTLVLAGASGLILLTSTRSTSTTQRTVMPLAEAVRQARYRVACYTAFAAGWQAQGARATLVPLFVVEALNRPAHEVGVAFAVAAIVQGLALGPVGRAVDTAGRRPILIGGLSLCAVMAVAIPFAPSMPWLTAALCLFGIGASALSTAPTAVLGDVTQGRPGNAVAMYQMSGDLGSILGPLLAGLIADYAPLWLAFGAGASIMAICALLSFVVRVEPEAPRSATVGS